MNLVLRPAAFAEMEAAAEWYEEQRTGLGDEFLAAVRSVLESIGEHPLRWAILQPGIRRALIRRFPYVLFYAVEGSSIVILRCRHTARRPLDQA